MYRAAAGVVSVLCENDLVIGADVVDDTENVLVITEKGYGKGTGH